MPASSIRQRICLALVVTALLAASGVAAEGPRTPANWVSGVGLSSLADPLAAGDEAAGRAKARLGGKPAKFVMVGAAEAQVTPELVAGVTRHFDAGIVYGCQITSPLTAESNFPDVPTIDVPHAVVVWALGGDTDVVVEWEETNPDEDDNYFNAGLRLAEKLRPALEASKRPGKLVFTFGDQYTGSNKDYVFGLNDGFGEDYPIVGAAAGNITAKEIIRGEIRTGVNLGVLIAGEFTLGQALNGGTHTPETADKTMTEAIADGGDGEPFFALIFNCRRRRQGMIERKQLGEELAAIKNRLPGVEFFGFYGPGEVGSKAFGEPAEGVGFTVTTAVFFAK